MASQTVTECRSKVSLVQLNYDCWLEMFQWFGFNELMNLAEAYDELQCAADYTYEKRFTTFTFDFSNHVECVFHHIGPFVRSLILDLDKFNFTAEDLKQIQVACNKLQSITLKGFDRRAVKNIPFCDVADKVEMLSLSSCLLENDEDFFNPFKNLKCLNINRCTNISVKAVTKCFENNPGLTSFWCDPKYLFYPQLLNYLPNIEQLCVNVNNKRLCLNSLSTLNRLRNLTLHCWNTNVNDILIKLAKKNLLEKLELIDIKVDRDTFEIISLMDKLQLLVVTTCSEFNSFITLPPNIKSLKLECFQISQEQILLHVKQFQHLQHIHLANCTLDQNGTFISDFDTMADLIVQMLSLDINRQINVILTSYGNDNSLKVN